MQSLSDEESEYEGSDFSDSSSEFEESSTNFSHQESNEPDSSNFSLLPNDILIQIFLLLKLKTIFCLCKTNKRILSICSSLQFWRQKFLIVYPQKYLSDQDFNPKMKFKQIHLTELTNKKLNVLVPLKRFQIREMVSVFCSGEGLTEEEMINIIMKNMTLSQILRTCSK